MSLLRKFQQIWPMSSLLTIYKTFIRSRLDYADIIYDQDHNFAFHDKLVSIQYNTWLAWLVNNRYFNIKVYQELGLASLKSRPWFVGLENCHFYKIFNEKSPSYLFNLIPIFNRLHNTRISYNIPPIKVRRTIILKTHFFLYFFHFFLHFSWVEQAWPQHLKLSKPRKKEAFKLLNYF